MNVAEYIKTYTVVTPNRWGMPSRFTIYPNRRPHLPFSSAELTALVKKHTAFKSLRHMTKADAGYRPALRDDCPEQRAIADAYDAYQYSKGDARRASIHRRDEYEYAQAKLDQELKLEQEAYHTPRH